jgi:hypothetical protein
MHGLAGAGRLFCLCESMVQSTPCQKVHACDIPTYMKQGGAAAHGCKACIHEWAAAMDTRAM